MRFSICLIEITLCLGALGLQAQNENDQPQLTTRAKVAAQPAPTAQPASTAVDPSITVPAGTKIPLIMKQGVTTKNARVGDPCLRPDVLPDRRK